MNEVLIYLGGGNHEEVFMMCLHDLINNIAKGDGFFSRIWCCTEGDMDLIYPGPSMDLTSICCFMPIEAIIVCSLYLMSFCHNVTGVWAKHFVRIFLAGRIGQDRRFVLHTERRFHYIV